MYPHRIRLRGPWECEVEGQAPRRVTMPCRWADAGLADFRGLARFVRKFGYPGKIDHTEHVWLTSEGVNGCCEVRLNDQHLSEDWIGAVDVTAILTPRNRLEVLIDGSANDAGMWGEVALEIRKDAYLSALQLERAGTGISVVGLVVGTAPQPLELYTLVDNHHADYRTIMPTLAGEPFRIDLPEVGSHHQVVRVELIHISAIWYVVQLPIPPWRAE